MVARAVSARRRVGPYRPRDKSRGEIFDAGRYAAPVTEGNILVMEAKRRKGARRG